MKTFRINRNIEVVCESQNTRSGFRHLATLLYKGNECDTAKCTYLNRTWESYQFESVLHKLAETEQTLSPYQKGVLKKFIKDGGRVEDELKPLKTVATMASMGDLFGKTKKEKNDFKTRILRAGLENKGLIIPDDWDELSEDDKEDRLNKVLEQLNKS